MRFLTRIEQSGGNATGILVPAEVTAQIGPGRRYPVVVTIGNHSYRSSVTRYRGAFMIALSAENRAAAGVSGGDEVEVDLELDDAPRTVDVPADLAAVLDGEAEEFFDGLSYSHQRAYTLWIDEAKKPETRAARVAKALEMLREGKKR